MSFEFILDTKGKLTKIKFTKFPSTLGMLIVLAISLLITISNPTIYATSVPSSVVPIKIANSQSNAVPAGTQIQVRFDPSLLSPLRSNLGNIRFYRADDWSDQNRMYAWLENITSTYVVVWLRLADPIPANGSIIVYMALMPTSIDYDGVYWGRYTGWSNPSPYDNGNYVFNFYDHFGSTTLNVTNWPLAQGCNGGLTVENYAVGVFGGSPPCYYTGIGNSIATDPTKTVMDWLGYSSQLSETLSGFFVSSGSKDTTGQAKSRIYQHHIQGSYRYELCNGGGSCVKFPSGPTTNAPQLFSIWADSTQAHMMMNYYPSTEVTNNASFTSVPNMGIMFNAGTGVNWVAWVRIRNQPPNNANPTTTLLPEQEASSTTNIAQSTNSLPTSITSTEATTPSSSIITSTTSTLTSITTSSMMPTTSGLTSSSTTSEVSTTANSLTLTTTRTVTQGTTVIYISTSATQSSVTAPRLAFTTSETTPSPQITVPPSSIGTSVAIITALLAVGLTFGVLFARFHRRRTPTSPAVESPKQVTQSKLEEAVTDPYATVDGLVLRYLEDHNGEISVSKAVQDLGITESDLRSSLSRLSEKGRIQKS